VEKKDSVLRAVLAVHWALVGRADSVMQFVTSANRAQKPVADVVTYVVV
jgi:hypothetical protein